MSLDHSASDQAQFSHSEHINSKIGAERSTFLELYFILLQVQLPTMPLVLQRQTLHSPMEIRLLAKLMTSPAAPLPIHPTRAQRRRRPMIRVIALRKQSRPFNSNCSIGRQKTSGLFGDDPMVPAHSVRKCPIPR